MPPPTIVVADGPMRDALNESRRFDRPVRRHVPAWLSRLFHRFFAAPIEQQLWAMMVPGLCAENAFLASSLPTRSGHWDNYHWN